jgi:hypothetical protein
MITYTFSSSESRYTNQEWCPGRINSSQGELSLKASKGEYENPSSYLKFDNHVLFFSVVVWFPASLAKRSNQAPRSQLVVHFNCT